MTSPVEPVSEMSYRCPNCHALVHVADEFVGKVVDCPQCSAPFEAQLPVATPILSPTDRPTNEKAFRVNRPTDDETIIRSTHPALFRKHPIQLLTMIALGIGGLVGIVTGLFSGSGALWVSGLLTLMVIGGYSAYVWLQILSTSLTVTSKRTTVRRGILSKQTSEVQHDDVRNLQVQQNVYERFVGIGDVAISSSGQDGLEIVVHGVADPNSIAELIRNLQ